MLYYDILLAEDCYGKYMWKVLEDSDDYTEPKIIKEGREDNLDSAYTEAKIFLQYCLANRNSESSEEINFNGIVIDQSEETELPD